MSIECIFEILEPEHPESLVGSPQTVVFNRELDLVSVVVYFMANGALQITGGEAKSALGKVKLQYTAESPSGAYTACQSLRKIMFTFENAGGMASVFEFIGQKT